MQSGFHHLCPKDLAAVRVAKFIALAALSQDTEFDQNLPHLAGRVRHLMHIWQYEIPVCCPVLWKFSPLAAI